MELLNYIKLNVYITLKNGFYYKGKVIFADNNSISLIDFRGQRVSISADEIKTITEVKNA
jgi:hypothetical protein